MCSLPNPSPSFFKLQDGPGALSLFCLRWRWDVLRVRVLLVPTRTFFYSFLPKTCPPSLFKLRDGPGVLHRHPPTYPVAGWCTQMFGGMPCVCASCSSPREQRLFNISFFFSLPKTPPVFSSCRMAPVSVIVVVVVTFCACPSCLCLRVRRCFAHWVQSARWAAMVQASLLVCLHGLAA